MELISFRDILPRIYKVIPGLIKDTFWCITGATGSAKSFFTTFLFVLHPYYYCKRNNIPLKVISFSLEESEEKAFIRMQSEMLRERYGLNLTYYQYLGYHEGRTAAHDKALAEIAPEVEEMKKDISIISHIYNPTGMRKKVDEILQPLGKRIEGEGFTDSEGNKSESWTWEWNNPKQMVIIICDHVSMISPEMNKGRRLSTHEAMQLWNDYCTQVFIKKYNAICCNVQQQLVSGTVSQSGRIEDYEPSISKLANNLELSRDYTNIIGIFDPVRYGLNKYKGIDLTKYKGFRSISVLKHRFGIDNDVFPLLFKGTPKFIEIDPTK